MLEASLGCLLGGCLGLVPILGLPAAVWACRQYRLVRKLQPTAGWNAARPQLVTVAILAGAGLFVSSIALGGILVAIVCQVQR